MPLNAFGLDRDIRGTVARAQRALGMSHRAFGEALGASERTSARWAAGQSSLGGPGAMALARLVYPCDRDLAVQLAAATGNTLASLGIEAPVDDGMTSGPVAKALVVDSIVCVAAEKLGAAPGSVREALASAFRRARELGLSLQDVESALASPPARAKAGAGKARKDDGAG